VESVQIGGRSVTMDIRVGARDRARYASGFGAAEHELMYLNVPLVRRLALRVLAGRHVELRTLASRSWQLCPEGTRTIPPALFLSAMEDRIRQLSPWRSRDQEALLVRGGLVEDAPSTAYLLEDVSIVDGHLFKGPARGRAGAKHRLRLLRRRAPRLRRFRERALVSHWTGSDYFGNYLLDTLPLALLEEGDWEPLRVPEGPYRHAEDYRMLTALREAPVIDRARVDRLVVYTDFAQNVSKAERYAELRLRIRRSVAPGPPPPGVFIRRGQTGERRVLQNEGALEAALIELGFAIVDPDSMSAAEVTAAILDARIVMAVEGSHLSHGIYSMAGDGGFLVIQPPERFAMAYKEYADRMEMPFAFVVGHPSTEGFTVDVDEVLRTLDLLQTALAQSRA
jgi:hypothetical protein